MAHHDRGAPHPATVSPPLVNMFLYFLKFHPCRQVSIPLENCRLVAAWKEYVDVFAPAICENGDLVFTTEGDAK